MEIKVFCEFEKKRMYVGGLRKDGDEFVFSYDRTWLRYNNCLPLGPDLPLHSKEYRSPMLFSSFTRRLPPRNSENYARYCKERGISVKENDVMILLGTVAHKGASSFVFEIDRSKERYEEVLNTVRGLVSELSFDIVASGFGVNKTGLHKLLGGEVKPEKSGIYDVLELCVFNHKAAVWKINQSLMLPDRTKISLIRKLARGKN